MDQEESLILWCKGSFSLLQCFYLSLASPISKDAAKNRSGEEGHHGDQSKKACCKKGKNWEGENVENNEKFQINSFLKMLS